ncbi:MAG TPA: DUF2877 domain-containing protein [Candidatus Limnocylindrales bacterium]
MENRGVLRRAVTVSTALRPFLGSAAGADGVVLSVYRSAVNLLVAGELVTLASARGGGLPNGVLLADSFEPVALGVRSGMAVAASARRLDIPGGLLHVDLVAPQWDPLLRPSHVPADIGGRVAVARGALAGGTLIAGGRLTDGGLAPAARKRRDSAIELAGTGLIGLGPGLTPSGDDVLVGFTAGLSAIGDPRARRLARAWAGAATGRTTDVAVAFHRAAARGFYAERLHVVARALLAGPVEAIPEAIRLAAAWGATSGSDTLAGFLLALDTATQRRAVAA